MLSKNLLIYKHIIFTMTNQNVLKNDLPITKFDDDKLDRQKFALQMRRIIKNYKKKDCLTLGIMGSWGSGKTSLINMVFDQNKDNILKCEYLIPDVLTMAIEEGYARTKVLPTTAKWEGVTYKEDKDSVVKAIQKLMEEGVYPQNLWKK